MFSVYIYKYVIIINDIINVADSMKYKNLKDINNYNMYIKEILISLNYLFINYNLCIDKSIYPDNMKDSIIKPIYKNNNNQLITHYIIISLLGERWVMWPRG